jgi:hypothetical protein
MQTPALFVFRSIWGLTLKTRGSVNRNRSLLTPGSKPPISSRYALPFVKAGVSLPFLQKAFAGLHPVSGARGGVVIKAPRYKPAGRGFDSRWSHWNFSVT